MLRCRDSSHNGLSVTYDCAARGSAVLPGRPERSATLQTALHRRAGRRGTRRPPTAEERRPHLYTLDE
jgi:hypothetical protein